MEGIFQLKELELDLSFVLCRKGAATTVEFLDASGESQTDPARVHRIRLKYEAQEPMRSLRIDPGGGSFALDRDRMEEIKESVSELFGDNSEFNIPTILRPAAGAGAADPGNEDPIEEGLSA